MELLKPRIWFTQGLWRCHLDGLTGIGNTPSVAYHAWKFANKGRFRIVKLA